MADLAQDWEAKQKRWTARKRRTVLWLHLCLYVIPVGAWGLIQYRFLDFPGKAHTIFQGLSLFISSQTLASWMSLIVLAIYIVPAYFGSRRLAEAIEGRFFAQTDDWRVAPISDREIVENVGGFLMPWCPPQPGEVRHHVWQTLTGVIANSIKRTSRRDVIVPFGFVTISGRPGAGKSRMAREVLRSFAGIDIKRNSLDAWRKRRRQEWRRQFYFFAPPPADIVWDIAEIKCSSQARLDHLKDWIPLRPTLLWLDDADKDTTKRVLDTLRIGASDKKYRYPVRLMIVSQTLAPSTSDMDRRDHRLCDPLQTVLDEKTYLSDTDIAWIAKKSLRHAPDLDEADVSHIRDVTEANPFLLELAMDWLENGDGDARTMSREELYRQRVQRIHNSLAAAGFPTDDPKAMKWLAVATLAGPGCSFARVEKAVGREIYPATLTPCFPADEKAGLDFEAEAPAIRPQKLGDYFVRSVVEKNSKRQIETASEICTAACGVRLEGWFAAVERLAGEDHALATALRVLPKEFPREASFLLRYLKIMCALTLRGQWPDLDALVHMDDLLSDPELEAAIAPQLSEWFDAEVMADAEKRRRYAYEMWDLERGLTTNRSREYDEYKFIHSTPLTLIGACVMSHVRAARKNVSLALDHVHMLGSEIKYRGANEMSHKQREVLNAALDRVFPTSSNSGSSIPSTEEIKKLMMQLLYFPSGDWLGYLRLKVRAWLMHRSDDYSHLMYLFNEMAFGWDRKPEFVDKIENQLSLIPHAFSDGWVQTERAAAWRIASSDSADRDISACKKFLQRIEAIASNELFLHDPQLQRERAWGWRTLAWAHAEKADLADCKDAVKQVDAVASNEIFESDPVMQEERAHARRNLTWAFARTGDTAGCSDAARQVDAIASNKLFSDHLAIQATRADTWMILAIACSNKNDSLGCRKAIGEVEAIARNRLFADHAPMQQRYSSALLELDHSGEPHLSDCKDVTHRIETIASDGLFANNLAIQRDRAHAWRHLVRAYAIAADSAGCREAALQIDIIAGNKLFADDPHIQGDRVRAWTYVASEFLRTNKFEESKLAAEEVEKIASRRDFAKERDIQYYRAIVWRNLTFLLSRQKDKIGARAAYDRVSSIVDSDDRFRTDPEFLEQLHAAEKIVLEATGD